MDGKIIQLASSNPNPINQQNQPQPTQLARPQPIPNQDIVDKLEVLLEEAKAGIIQGAAVAIWTHDGQARSMFSPGPHIFEMIGVLSWLRHRMEQGIESSY